MGVGGVPERWTVPETDAAWTGAIENTRRAETTVAVGLARSFMERFPFLSIIPEA